PQGREGMGGWPRRAPITPNPCPNAVPVQKPALETVRSSLRLLNASAYRLQSECRKTVPPEPVWLTTQNHSTLVTERSAVPFLPVNPEYSATRNQGRQKLARFNAREFATLLIDILGEAKRRQQGKSPLSPTDALDYSLRSQSDLDDQHDYDSVASDEDTDQELLRNASRNNRARSMDSSDLSDGPITLQEYLEVKKALAASEAKVQQLMKVNNSLSDELRRLQREVGQAPGIPSSPPPHTYTAPAVPEAAMHPATHAALHPRGSDHLGCPQHWVSPWLRPQGVTGYWGPPRSL
uniref:GIT Spa2 homology (SHD) domain-containing protein n=1 Tax=Meleagris gallopavo TaxID=9103 RepID=A0A803YGU2_MELGA